MRILILLFALTVPLLAAGMTEIKTIHVYVALCDNANQGIAPVPEKLGNGQNPIYNLYWGAGYGVKTYFHNSNDWNVIKVSKNVDLLILERILYKHKTSNTYMLADAYDGAQIAQTTIDFLEASAGRNEFQIDYDGELFCFGGDANLLSYIGHNALMDFEVTGAFTPASTNKIETIILACYSKYYFSKKLKETGAYPLLWTSHLIAPEAYTLKYAIDGWIKKEDNYAVAERAAQAYHQYQSCRINTARELLVTGF